MTGYQTDSIATLPKWEATRRYLPSLLRAAVITLVLSCGAMLLAVALGVAIATGRLYGGRLDADGADRLCRADSRDAAAAAALRAVLRHRGGDPAAGVRCVAARARR